MHGKTTFIKKFFNTKIPNEVKKNLIYLYIDCRKVSDDDNIDVEKFIYSNCLQQIREKYSFLKIDDWYTLKKIYNLEIMRYQKGVLKPIYENNVKEFDIKISDILMEKIKDETQFTKDILRYLGTKMDLKKSLCLVIDNADQLNESFQRKAFLEAQAFNENFHALSIISLREESYWAMHKIKPFDAYIQYAYHIVAPSISKMLRKRLDVAIRRLDSREEITLTSSNNITVKIKMRNFLEILKDSLFQGYKPSEITKFIEAMSVKDLRTASKMLTAFLISGHTNTMEYIRLYLTHGQYIIPYHAFVRSVALGDYRYYKSERSLLPNIFLIEDEGFFSHFTILRILTYLKRRINIGSAILSGYVEIESMYKDFKGIYPVEEKFRKVIDILLKNRLVMANNGYNINANEASHIKITSAGYYFIENLIYEFSYLERLCEDTPITNIEYYDKINQISEEINYLENNITNKKVIIDTRLKRVDIFLEYLEKCERDDNKYIESEDIKYDFTSHIIDRYNKEKIYIKQNLAKQMQ